MLHLVRHGETEWSRSRRHTGTTDIGLTTTGVEQAASLAGPLGELDADVVLASPLRRAIDTAAGAGFGDRVRIDDRLREWDYGFAEGRTTAEIRDEIPGWSVWTNPITEGESLQELSLRIDDLLADLADHSSDVLVFGHAHHLRVLAARWCGLPASAGQHLTLEPASLSTLGHERECPAIIAWNVRPLLAADARRRWAGGG